jgi:putative NADH-flavin reductase
MKITIFGGVGSVGSRAVAEALSRGCGTRAVVREEARIGDLPEGVEPRVGDLTRSDDLPKLSLGQDFVISATCPDHADGACAILRNEGNRLWGPTIIRQTGESGPVTCSPHFRPGRERDGSR